MLENTPRKWDTQSLPVVETITIPGDGEEPDTIIEIPPGTQKVDWLFIKVMMALRQFTRLHTETHTIAVAAREDAACAKADATFAKRFVACIFGLLTLLAVLAEVLRGYGLL